MIVSERQAYIKIHTASRIDILHFGHVDLGSKVRIKEQKNESTTVAEDKEIHTQTHRKTHIETRRQTQTHRKTHIETRRQTQTQGFERADNMATTRRRLN
jgi:hypothetical protein